MKGEPDFLQNLRDEMGDGRQWLDRAIVIAYAVLAGLAVVLLTLLAEAAFSAYQALRGAAWWAPLLWTPALTALIVWATRRWAPGAAGSPRVRRVSPRPCRRTGRPSAGSRSR